MEKRTFKCAKGYFINSLINEAGTWDPGGMVAVEWLLPGVPCPGPAAARRKASQPGALALEHTVVGFVIYNVRPTNKSYYSNMWSKPKERSTLN